MREQGARRALKKSAHKADLFRYCYLYLKGGIWIDIKTVLIRPVSEIFGEHGIYTVRSLVPKLGGATCYQGILAVPPRSLFMHDMIDSFLSVANMVDDLGYLTFCRQMHIYLETQYDQLRVGTNKGDVDLHLFEEYHATTCQQLDRYGFCTYVRDEHGKDLFKVRDHEFPHGAWAQ